MDFEKIYSMITGDVRSPMVVDLRFPDQMKEFEIVRGRFPSADTLVFDHVSGTRLVDWMSTTLFPVCLVSHHLISVLREAGFTGWTTIPAHVFSKAKAQIPGYHVFGVTGRCGRIDNTRSTQVWRPAKETPEKKFRTWLGLYFDPPTWDGSDIFGPDHTGWIFVVQKVKDALVKAKITNVSFEALTQIERLML
jgi:hypothetical protein